jgi:hypothetical protein
MKKATIIVVGTGVLLVAADSRFAPVVVAFLAVVLAYTIIKPGQKMTYSMA